MINRVYLAGWISQKRTSSSASDLLHVVGHGCLSYCGYHNSRRRYGNGNGRQRAGLYWNHQTCSLQLQQFSFVTCHQKLLDIFQYYEKARTGIHGGYIFGVGLSISILPQPSYPVLSTCKGLLYHTCQQLDSFAHLNICPYSFWICKTCKKEFVSASS